MENTYTEINTKGRQYEQLKGSAFSSCQATQMLPMEVWCDVSEAGAYINCQDSKGKPLEQLQKVESTLGPSRMDKVGDSRHFRLRD